MSLAARGFEVFPRDEPVARWAGAVRPEALATLDDPAFAGWWRAGGTWFAGVNALPNDAEGRTAAAPALAGAAVAAAREMADLPLDRAQVSVCRPGYPRPDPGESESSARYRRTRDAAHLDGLRAIGPQRRRHVSEPHGWILGIALTDCGPGASPLVAWEGSHEVLRAALKERLDGVPADRWAQEDVTDAYQDARRRVFQTCRRVELPLRPGEAVLLHRLVLHGVAPWADDAKAPPDGRVIAYFRPLLPRLADWLALP